MNSILAILAALVAGYLVACAFYGGDILFSSLIRKWKLQKLEFFSSLIISLLLMAVLSLFVGKDAYRFRNLNDPTIYLAVVITIALTLLIVSFVPRNKHFSGRELALAGLGGACIEFAQRPMMQPFVWWILIKLGFPHADVAAVVITGTIWCLGITTSYILEKVPMNREFALELFASFVFSMGIGYAFQRSGFIPLSILAHATEQMLFVLMVNHRYDANTQK